MPEGWIVHVLLLAVVALASMVPALLWMRRERAALRARLDALEARLRLDEQSISGLTAGALGMDRRLRRVEANGKWLAERQETLENQQLPDQPYGQAIRMVQQGAGVRELVDALALSESEAELLVRLHGLRDSA